MCFLEVTANAANSICNTCRALIVRSNQDFINFKVRIAVNRFSGINWDENTIIKVSFRTQRIRRELLKYTIHYEVLAPNLERFTKRYILFEQFFGDAITNHGGPTVTITITKEVAKLQLPANNICQVVICRHYETFVKMVATNTWHTIDN